MIAGRYEELDDGLARDVELGRVVRIRWIDTPDEVDDPRLSHPAVVRVYDIGQDNGRRFAAIEHVHGLLPLALSAPLPPDKAVYVGTHAARALAAAHALGLARDVELGRVVRIRWIDTPDEVDDPRLSHPAVVRVYDIGEDNGRRFAAIEHVHGLLPLALSAPLPPDKAVYVGTHAARALAAAHALGLVHAGEILVRNDGVPKLAGFRAGEPGADVRALAEALNDAAPALPPLSATTAAGLVKELEDIRPTVATQVLTPLPTRRSFPLLPTVIALAVVALVVGLVFAFRGGGSAKPRQRGVAPVVPVPHAATAERQARNLSAWLARYSSR